MGSAPAIVVPVRLHADLHAAVRAQAAAESTFLSELVRDALRAYLAGEIPAVGDLRTASGRVLTDAEIEALATEAEAGYDISALRVQPGRRGRPWAELVPVRMPPELKAEVERRAEAESTSASEIVRAALRTRLGGGLSTALGSQSQWLRRSGPIRSLAREFSRQGNYASLLDVPFAYSTNGQEIVEDDRNTGIERDDLVGFPFTSGSVGPVPGVARARG